MSAAKLYMQHPLNSLRVCTPLNMGTIVQSLLIQFNFVFQVATAENKSRLFLFFLMLRKKCNYLCKYKICMYVIRKLISIFLLITTIKILLFLNNIIYPNIINLVIVYRYK